MLSQNYNLKKLFYFTFGSIAGKLSFVISSIIYVKIFSEQTYANYELFYTSITILAVGLSLSVHSSVGRYVLEKDPDDINRFLSSTILLSIIVFLSLSSILYTSNYLNELFLIGNEIVVLICILLSLLYNIYVQYVIALRKSYEYNFINTIKLYSVILITFISYIFFNKIDIIKYQYIYLICNTLILLFILYKYRNIFDFRVKINDIKYISNYSLPLYPYSLILLIIPNLNKYILDMYTDSNSVVVYSLSLYVGSILLIIVEITHNYWNPIYFDLMNNNKFNQVSSDTRIIMKITAFFAVIFYIISSPIAYIIYPKIYIDNMDYIYLIIFGVYMLQACYIYFRILGYVKKTKFMSYCMILSACIGLSMNLFLVKNYGYLGAMLSFLISYVVLFIILHIIVHKYTNNVFIQSFLVYRKYILLLFTFFTSLFIIDYYTLFVNKVLLQYSLSVITLIYLIFENKYDKLRAYVYIKNII